MSRYLRLDKSQYGLDGLVPLTVGDDWNLVCRVVSLIGGQDLDQNITGTIGASAFFPAASGGVFMVPVTISDPLCGQLMIPVPQTVSSGAAVSQQGVAPYVTLQDSAGLHTLYPYDTPLQISSRGVVTY